jgi:hypothetical protein
MDNNNKNKNNINSSSSSSTSATASGTILDDPNVQIFLQTISKMDTRNLHSFIKDNLNKQTQTQNENETETVTGQSNNDKDNEEEVKQSPDMANNEIVIDIDFSDEEAGGTNINTTIVEKQYQSINNQKQSKTLKLVIGGDTNSNSNSNTAATPAADASTADENVTLIDISSTSSASWFQQICDFFQHNFTTV